MPKEKIGNVDTDKKVTAQTILWKFFLRVKDKQNREAGIGSSLGSDIEDFKEKYAKSIDDDELAKILGYVTNNLGKGLEIIKRK